MLHAFRDRHAVVTGGAGFLGSHLCARLLEAGARVTALDNFLTGTPDNVAQLVGDPGFRLLHYDVTDFLHVPGEVDHILHFASPASPLDYLRWPIQTLKVGSLGTHKALGLARAKGARLLLASTSEVYGDPQVNPQPETYWGNVNPVGPRGVYDEAKRFAEALTLAYHRQHGVDVRIARIFNSVLADEQVLYDDGTQLRREPVESLARRLGIAELPGDVPLQGYRVPAFSADGEVAASAASYLVGHPTTQRCFEVRTRYGRSVRVTGDHSLFVEGPAGEPVPRPVTRLEVGERIAIAGRVVVPERERASVSMVEVWDRALLDPWDLIVTAPGLGARVHEQRFEIMPLLEARSMSPESARGTLHQLMRRDELPLAVFRKLSLSLPDEAQARVRMRRSKVRMPLHIPVTDALLWTLGLYVADGCRDDRTADAAFITISAEPALLVRAGAALEALGVHLRRAAGGPARSPAILVHGQLLLLLLDHLGFTGSKRIPGWVLGLPLHRLKWFLEGYRQGDVPSGHKHADQRPHEFSTVSDELKDDLVVALGRFGLVPSVGRYETTFRQRTGERRSPFWRITLSRVEPWSPLAWDAGVQQTLQARRRGDLVWAPVTAITEVEPTPLVYDLSVPGRENFYAGTGVMAHNTYGPTMRTDDGRAVPAFFTAALKGEPLPVFGDGQQTRSLCYVDDEVEGLLRLLASDYVGPVNIGNPQEVTMLELAEAVQDAVGNHPGVVFRPAPEDDPQVRRPDTTLAEEVLGWTAEIPLDEGLRRTAGWFRQQLGFPAVAGAEREQA